VAVAGFADGVQMGNSLAVANRLGGEKEMLFVLGVEQLTQGAGVFIWGFTIGMLLLANKIIDNVIYHSLEELRVIKYFLRFNK